MKKILDFRKIRQAAYILSQITEKQKNQFVDYLSGELQMSVKEIIKANREDILKLKDLDNSFKQRLLLDGIGIVHLREKLASIKKLQSCCGETIEDINRNNGLRIKKVRVPLGVIAIIYESRPEVTIDVAALCIRSGNVVILKGGSEAIETNKKLYRCIQRALGKMNLPSEIVNFISNSDRKITDNLLKQNKYIDLVIARGGYNLVKYVQSVSTIPVLAHAAGGARIYVDESADQDMAIKIIVNAKTSKPSACNSVDTVVVHKNIEKDFIPTLATVLRNNGIHIMFKNVDWKEEFLGLTIGIKVVSDINEAIRFINTNSKHHSEGIVAKSKKVVKQFVQNIDAAGIFVNCSTRFHDGYEFGLGAEMGIATGKLHARGPVGLKELTTYKWEVYGNGHIRE